MKEQEVKNGKEATHTYESVGYVEDGEIDELKIEEIDHALADDTVDLIADTASRDHGKGNTDGGREGLAIADQNIQDGAHGDQGDGDEEPPFSLQHAPSDPFVGLKIELKNAGEEGMNVDGL